MSSNTVAVPLNDALRERLARLAAETERSEAELAAQAIEEFLAVQDWQIAGIKSAMASIERGAAVPHEEVADWVGSWGGEEKQAPRR
jgi:RHH-type rel operon transcriptional repressor/antitoxin RelB